MVPAAVALLGYAWVLGGWFLYDDFTQGYLLEHDAPGIDGNWGPILKDFGRAQFGIEEWVYYRAMMSVYLTGCLELFGVDPIKLHAVNLAHHVVLSALVALLCGLYCRPRPNLAAICGGAWFALHPVTVEPIAWFSGNTVTFELLARIGSMGAFALYLRSSRGAARGLALATSLALAVLALVTKESAINLPVALVALHLLSTPTPTLRQLVVTHLPFVPIWVGYFVLRYLALGTFVAGAHAGTGSFLAAVPDNVPLQLKAVFAPFGGPLPGGLLIGALVLAVLVWGVLRGMATRGGPLVLGAGALWLATQFLPTALNRVEADLGSSRAHYGTLVAAALVLCLLVFGRRRTGNETWPLSALGVALFAGAIAAFLPVRAERRQRFEEAWESNRRIHADLVRHGETASPARPVAVVWTPYDHFGVPQLNRNAHFTLAEVPFVPQDLPVLGLTTLLVECGMGKEMVGDASPLRAARELGAELLAWDIGASAFRELGAAREPATLPPATPATEPGRFELAHAVSPFAIEELELRVAGAADGGTIGWGGPRRLTFGAGRRDGADTVFRIDLTHHDALVMHELAGGIAFFDVALAPHGAAATPRELALFPRVASLPLDRELAGAEIVFGSEARALTAPASPAPELAMRCVLLAPSEPIAIPVAAGQPVAFPRYLDGGEGPPLPLHAELKRLLRLSRQKRFYYYFEARHKHGDAVASARSRVDWFRLRPPRD